MSHFSLDRRPRESRALPFTDNVWPGIIFFGLFASAALYIGGWWAWENHRFDDHAQQVEAKVLRKYLVESHGKNGPYYTPHLAYGYQVGKVIVNCDVEVARDTWDQVDERGGIPILYLPEEPTDNRIENTAEELKPLMKSRIGLGAGLFVFAIGTIATVAVWRRKKRVEKIRLLGLSARGHVTAVDRERVGKVMKAFFRFEFTDNQSRVVLGRSLYLTRRQEKLWKQGKKITVYYDPRDSSFFTVNPNAG